MAQRVFEPVAFPGAVDDMGPMGQTVQERCRQVGITEDLGPVGKAKIGGDNHRAPFVTFGKNLEKQLGTFLGQGDVAELINDEQPIAGVPLDDATELSLLPGFDKFVGKTAAGYEPCPDPQSAGLNAEGGGKMRFARSRCAEKDDVSVLADVGSFRQLTDEPPVKPGGCLKIEGLERLEQGKLRVPESSLEPALGSRLELDFSQSQQELPTVKSVFPGLAEVGLQRSGPDAGRCY